MVAIVIASFAALLAIGSAVDYHEEPEKTQVVQPTTTNIIILPPDYSDLEDDLNALEAE